MIIFLWALVAGAIMLIMKTSRYRPPFRPAPAWRDTRTAYVARHRSAIVPDRDWAIA